MSSERSTPELISRVGSFINRVGIGKLAAAGGATALTLALAVSAGAAPSPVDPFAEVLGLGGARGAEVSQAAHDAKAAAQETGDNVGIAVSTAVCLAKVTENLPLPAQDAPGHEKERDCTHPNAVAETEDEVTEDEVTEEETAEEEATEEEATEDETEVETQSEHENRGALVSQAAHDAKTAAQDAGEKVGPAVSEAVCMVIQDRGNLPEGAQNAPGQQGREPKDCTHPSNRVEAAEEEAETTESGGESGGRGRGSAPGQLKKQGN